MNPFEIAIDNLETYGWIQSRTINMDSGARCLRGAFHNAWSLHPTNGEPYHTNLLSPVTIRLSEAYILLAKIIKEQYPDFVCVGDFCEPQHSYVYIAEWNDAAFRNKEEVIAVLEKASLQWEE